MDFRPAPEDERFRGEVKAFLAQHWSVDEDLFKGSSEELFRLQRPLQRKLAERGWLTLAWPEAYGGKAASHIRQTIYQEEMARAGAPAFDNGVNLVGPCLMVHGTEEQKRRFLPPIARADVYWCQGFSEPGAGSDLASLQTRAVRDGDEFVISGQKIWNSGAQFADWIHLLARTDPDAPKHRGISYFMIDMRSPGISYRTIEQLNGRSRFNQTFFDNVRVPANQVIGEVNRGWYAATTTLDFERSGIAYVVEAERLLDRLIAHVRKAPKGAMPPPAVAVSRVQLAELQVEVAVARWLAYRVAWMQGKGLVPNHEASMSKVFATELSQRVARLGANLLGLYGGLSPRSDRLLLHGHANFMYLHTVSTTIAGGTSEIQRNIIASRGLGLPRS